MLRGAGVRVDPGLTDGQLDAIERRFGFRFGVDHRRLLLAGQPVGGRWYDWRTAEPSDPQLSWPLEGMLFDVEHDQFWPASWPPRPDDRAAAERIARDRYQRLPRLVPLYSHRYLPAAPAPSGCPVFSVHQTDVIHYGSDLANYLAREFAPADRRPELGTVRHRIPFWSDLAEGWESEDL